MPDSVSITPELLSSIAGIALSLAASYIPGVAELYASLSPVLKRTCMLGILTLTVLVIYGAACWGWIDPISCSRASFLKLLACLVQALAANQAAFLISPRRVHPLTRMEVQ